MADKMLQISQAHYGGNTNVNNTWAKQSRVKHWLCVERAQLPRAHCRHRKIRWSWDYGICVILGQMKESANVSMTHRQINSCECENGKKNCTLVFVCCVPHKPSISYHRTIWGITVWLIIADFSMFTHCLTCAVMRWGRRSYTVERSLLVRAERHGSGPSWQDGEGTSSSTYGSSWCCRW